MKTVPARDDEAIKKSKSRHLLVGAIASRSRTDPKKNGIFRGLTAILRGVSLGRIVIPRRSDASLRKGSSKG